MLNKKGLIENIVEINIYYQGHRERTEINVIGRQKWNVILKISQLARHNSEIDWRAEEVKMTRCSKECGKQQKPKQEKPGWQKQREEEKKEKAGKKREEKAEKQKKQKKAKTMDIKRVAEEWEIWDKEEEAAKLEAEAKKLVPEKFYKWIKVFGKKQSE